MRSVLVHAEDGPAGRVRLDCALSLARMTRGHVTALVDTPTGRFVAVDGLGGGAIAADVIRQEVARDDAFARQLDAQLAREDVPCDVLRSEAEAVAALARGARLADVVVVSRREAVSGDLPLLTRCPVLAVNDTAPLAFPLDRVAVAWDGSAEAAHALRSALPLLAAAGQVVVITVSDEPDTVPAVDALTYLSRHGVGGELRVIGRSGSVEETLARELVLLESQLMVMGAFGHSRLREFLFGGVTRYFLDNNNGPALLLAH